MCGLDVVVVVAVVVVGVVVGVVMHSPHVGRCRSQCVTWDHSSFHVFQIVTNMTRSRCVSEWLSVRERLSVWVTRIINIHYKSIQMNT